MKTKTFKTLDEQIDILTNKGLVFEDTLNAKSILLRENYFFLSGYRHVFLNPDGKTFIESTKFRELYAMFSFDRQLRNIIFKNILIVENNLKSILAYVMSKNHGFKENNYLNPHNFVRDSKKTKQINDLIRKMKRQISVNGKQHAATAHYLINYGYIPNTISGEGEELDAYIVGIFEPVEEYEGKCIAAIHRLYDDDDKLVIAPEEKIYTKQQIEALVEFQERFFEHEIIEEIKDKKEELKNNKEKEK